MLKNITFGKVDTTFMYKRQQKQVITFFCKSALKQACQCIVRHDILIQGLSALLEAADQSSQCAQCVSVHSSNGQKGHIYF